MFATQQITQICGRIFAKKYSIAHRLFCFALAPLLGTRFFLFWKTRTAPQNPPPVRPPPPPPPPLSRARSGRSSPRHAIIELTIPLHANHDCQPQSFSHSKNTKNTFFAGSIISGYFRHVSRNNPIKSYLSAFHTDPSHCASPAACRPLVRGRSARVCVARRTRCAGYARAAPPPPRV
jgi:hypothetical protein